MFIIEFNHQKIHSYLLKMWVDFDFFLNFR